MIPLAVIRPEPGCAATVAAARSMGIDAYGCPLFEVRPLAWKLPAEPVDALLVGSANAFRHGGPGLAQLRHLPVYAVGQITAEAARNAGFAVAAVGEGGLQSLFPMLAAPHRRLVRLAGRERVSLDPPPEVSLIERIVYASEPWPMPAGLAALLERPAAVLLHSAQAARHFRAECAVRGVVLADIVIAAIGPRVAEAAGPGWREVACAEQPSDAALLALARRLCQTALP